MICIYLWIVVTDLVRSLGLESIELVYWRQRENLWIMLLTKLSKWKQAWKYRCPIWTHTRNHSLQIKFTSQGEKWQAMCMLDSILSHPLPWRRRNFCLNGINMCSGCEFSLTCTTIYGLKQCFIHYHDILYKFVSMQNKIESWWETRTQVNVVDGITVLEQDRYLKVKRFHWW